METEILQHDMDAEITIRCATYLQVWSKESETEEQLKVFRKLRYEARQGERILLNVPDSSIGRCLEVRGVLYDEEKHWRICICAVIQKHQGGERDGEASIVIEPGRLTHEQIREFLSLPGWSEET
jgi:hypothetical protein